MQSKKSFKPRGLAAFVTGAMALLAIPVLGMAPFDETGEHCTYGGEDGYDLIECTQEPLENISYEYESSTPISGNDYPMYASARSSGSLAPAHRSNSTLSQRNSPSAAAMSSRGANEMAGDIPECEGVIPGALLKTKYAVHWFGYWNEYSRFDYHPAPAAGFGVRNIRRERGFWIWEQMIPYVHGDLGVTWCYDGSRVRWTRERANWIASQPWVRRPPEGGVTAFPKANENVPGGVDVEVTATAHFEKCPERLSGVTAGVQLWGVSGGRFTSNICVDGKDISLAFNVHGDGTHDRN